MSEEKYLSRFKTKLMLQALKSCWQISREWHSKTWSCSELLCIFLSYHAELFDIFNLSKWSFWISVSKFQKINLNALKNSSGAQLNQNGTFGWWQRISRLIENATKKAFGVWSFLNQLWILTNNRHFFLNRVLFINIF